jgi:hypothetical protein
MAPGARRGAVHPGRKSRKQLGRARRGERYVGTYRGRGRGASHCTTRAGDATAAGDTTATAAAGHAAADACDDPATDGRAQEGSALSGREGRDGRDGVREACPPFVGRRSRASHTSAHPGVTHPATSSDTHPATSSVTHPATRGTGTGVVPPPRGGRRGRVRRPAHRRATALRTDGPTAGRFHRRRPSPPPRRVS